MPGNIKVVFITGATSGIGLELAKIYLERGHKIGLSGRDISKIPSDVANHPLVSVYKMDVQDLASTKLNMQKFFEKHGRLDVVIANAGRSVGEKTISPLFDIGREVIMTNLMGVYNTFEVAFELMKRQGSGQLVAISSVAGYIGLPGAAAYSASKAGVLKLCESYAIDFKTFGIDVTAIAPGFIDTPLTKKNDHSMPFMLSTRDGSMKIFKAIEKKRVLYTFPWQMNFVVTLLEKMPRFMYRMFMRLKFLNYGKKHVLTNEGDIS